MFFNVTMCKLSHVNLTRSVDIAIFSEWRFSTYRLYQAAASTYGDRFAQGLCHMKAGGLKFVICRGFGRLGQAAHRIHQKLFYWK